MAATFGPYRGTVVNIHDGDTLDLDIVLVEPAGRLASKTAGDDVDLGFNVHRTRKGIVLERQPVRLYGCNAAELSTPEGKAALAYFQTLLKVGDTVTLISHGWDKYSDRIDGQITLADGSDLAQLMIAANQAAPWDGQGPKPVPTPA